MFCYLALGWSQASPRRSVQGTLAKQVWHNEEIVSYMRS
jgi:hypothetical protein